MDQDGGGYSKMDAFERKISKGKYQNGGIRFAVIRRMERNDLSERLLKLALLVGSVVDELPRGPFGRRVAWQLSGSGTSPMANYEEACGAESKADFIHKLRICLKELRESRAWATLILRAGMAKEARAAELLDECDQLARIFAQSIITAQNRKLKTSS